ncbi:MAG: hypothetical protein JXO44_05340 [Clostridia bacterium]|nr:hypothetical protein [Clostridia bacterium]
MNQANIEKTLQRIIEIDDESAALKKEIQALKLEKEQAMKKEAREMDLDLMKRARKLGKVERELIMSQAEEEIVRLREKNDAICQQMQRVMDHHVEELVNDVFEKLIGEHLKARAK